MRRPTGARTTDGHYRLHASPTTSEQLLKDKYAPQHTRKSGLSHIRRYANGKLIIKPSKAAVQRIRERLRTEMRALRGANAAAVLQRLNPIIRGWAAY